MVSIKNKVTRLEKELNEINLLLNEVNDDNFFNKFERINFLINDVKKIREELLNLYPKVELKKNEEKLTSLAKQIKLKLDNIIDEKEKLSKDIKRKLEIIQNKKKISNYKQV